MSGYKEEVVKIKKLLTNCNGDENEYVVGSNPKYCYNVKLDGGHLVGGKGIKKMIVQLIANDEIYTEFEMSEVGFNFVKLWKYDYYSERNSRQENMIIALGSDKKLYFSSLIGMSGSFSAIPISQTYEIVPDAINFIYNGDSVIGFASEQNPLFAWYTDKTPYELPNAPKFRSICLHGDRLFAIDSENNNLVRYSSNKNPLSWEKTLLNDSSGGSLELNDYRGGNLQKLLSFKDSIYIFQDYGISKITSYSTTKKFYTTNLYLSSTKIYSNTACICGEYIYFLAQDGLYYVDGYDIKKVDIKISSMMDMSQEEANSCFYNGKYYLACKIDFGESVEHNNCLLELDVETKQYSIIKGIDVVSMVPAITKYMNKLVFALRDRNILFEMTNETKIDSTFLEKVWQSGKIVVGDLTKTKILKDIVIKTDYDIDLTITTEKGAKTISILGKSNIQRVPLNIVGNEFDIKISSSNEMFRVSNFQLRFKYK